MPSIQPLTKDTWTKVATAVTTGQIEVLDTRARYQFAWVLTAAAAPTAGSRMIGWGKIQSSAPIDVYLLAERADGSVRLHL